MKGGELIESEWPKGAFFYPYPWGMNGTKKIKDITKAKP